MDSARGPEPVVSGALDGLGADGSSPIFVGYGPGHVVARRRDQIDVPTALDELCEVAAVAVDAGRTRRWRVLVHAQKSPGAARSLRLRVPHLFYGCVARLRTGC